jgi:hypothetical protein
MDNESDPCGDAVEQQRQAELLRKRDLVEQELLKLRVPPDVALERANNIVQALTLDEDEPVSQVVSEMLSKYINESDQLALIYIIKKICSRRSRVPAPPKIFWG